MKTRTTTDGSIIWWCPGCDGPHAIPVTGPKAWGFNGDRERPTFTPSVLVTGVTGVKRCHTFITDGRIQYIGDCSHRFVGLNVDIPEWPLPNYGGIVDEDEVSKAGAK